MYNFRSPLIALGLASQPAAYHNAGMVTPRRSPTVGVGHTSISRGQSYNGNHARHGGTHGSRRIRAARGAA